MDRNLAYVNVVGYATDEQDFQRGVSAWLLASGFDLVAMEDVKRFDSIADDLGPDAEFLDLASAAARTGSNQMGALHTWTRED
jgi:hypothetical protein